MNRKGISQLLASLAVLFCFVLTAHASNSNTVVAPMVSLLLSGATMQEKIPSLALMVATDTDKLIIAWVPGSDGKTPVGQIKYNIYLSTSENFIPGPSTLKKSVTGTSQTEITGLATDTLYYGVIEAVYAYSTSYPSNILQTKTYKYKVLVDNSATVAVAADLGLGKHTTNDGLIYTYSYTGDTPLNPGDSLFSEDVAGGMTLRTVDSSSSSGGSLTVHTSDASLTDVFDRGSIYSSFQLFDVASQANSLLASSKRIATSSSLTTDDGSQYSRIEWKDRLLVAEQTVYAYHEEDFILEPEGKSSLFILKDVDSSVSSEFSATVTAEFEPKLITYAEWGGIIFKHLDSAHVAAKGTLSLTAQAQYAFKAAGSVSKEFRLFKKTWVSVYLIGKVPVYQEITLSLDVKATAEAEAEINAMAQAMLTETVEVGARFNGSTWTPYITHNESDSLAASLSIAGKASAEIRLIPKIDVGFYKVSSASLTVEPFAQSSLTVKETTNNLDFLAAHPERLIQLSSFDASLGVESNVAVTFTILGNSWNLLPSTCVLGTGSCLYTFPAFDIFSIPVLELNATGPREAKTGLELQVADGISNPFFQSSINWEVFPDDASITPGICSKSGQTTTCTATYQPGVEEAYTVFVSGYGRVGEMGRQFKEMTLGVGTCSAGAQTVMWNEQTWQRCDDGKVYEWEEAKTYCQNLVLDGYSYWRLPTKDELKGLVVCTNGTPTPLQDWPGHPFYCGDGNSEPYDSPTIDSSFHSYPYYYWSSSTYDEDSAWFGDFKDGGQYWTHRDNNYYVRCVSAVCP